jgi:hypothetical protein
MTTMLPKVNTLVEVAVLGGERYGSRVEDGHGTRLTVAAPLNLLVSDIPATGTPVTVRWAGGARGRFSAPMRIAETRSGGMALWILEVTGPVQVEQNRRFVRGGGGEPIHLERRGDTPGPGPVRGRIIDLSERSVRGRFKDIEIQVGDEAGVRLVLDEEMLDMSGSILRVVYEPGEDATDVVAVYEPGEVQATAIRRYVLRQQMLDRARLADS